MTLSYIKEQYRRMREEPKFTFKLDEPGKAKASFQYGEDIVDFELANVSNPLSDLLRGLASLIFEPSHLWGEDNICHVEWYSENGCYKWLISTDGSEMATIKISQTDVIFGDSEDIVLLECECGFYSFCHAIISELDYFVKQIGLLNYEQKWQKDEFPITYLLFLKKYLIDNNHWRPSARRNGTLSDELLLLLA